MSDPVVKSVILLGKGSLAVKVAQWFLDSPVHDLKLVVPVMPEPSWTDSVNRWAEARGIECLKSGDWRDVPKGFRPDLALSIYYDRIVSADFIARCGQVLNLHNGPLPRYRGMAPVNWALKNGERSHGVTLHEVTAEIDAGPVVAQRLFPIDPDQDEVIDAYERCLEHGWGLLKDVLPRLDTLDPTPQDESQATYYSAKQSSLLGDRRYFTRHEQAPRDAS